MKLLKFKKKYKAIISDIDGALTANHPTALPNKKVKEAIRKVQDKGIAFSVASARPYHLLEYLVKDMDLKSPVIVNNGACIYDSLTKKILWESTIDNVRARQVLNFVKKLGRKFNIDYDHTKTKIYKIVILGFDRIESDKLLKQLEKLFKDLSIGKASSWIAPNLFDIYIANGGATKQHAVLELAKILNISTKEIIAIGDHYNDFALFMACGLKVAMGNAVADLKAIADYVAPNIDDDGVVDVLEKFIL